MQRQLGSRYVMDSLLGRGGMGEVWRGRSTEGEPLAFKLLQPALLQEPDIVRRFHDEYRVLETLNSPFVVHVRDLVVEGGAIAIVMDLVNGPDLRTHLRNHGTLPAAEAVRLTSEILIGLAAAHELHPPVIHRDLKPENVLLAPTETGVWRAMVTDFGIAKIVNRSTSLTGTAAVFGTPRYIAPEIATRGQRGASPAADIYSAGVLLYELLCGLTPFADFPAQVALLAPTYSAPGRPDGLPDPLWAVLAAMLARDPASRPATARGAAQSLANLLPSLEGIAALPPLDLAPEPVQLDTANPTQPTERGVANPTPQPPPGRADQDQSKSGSWAKDRKPLAAAVILVAFLALWGLFTVLRDNNDGGDQGTGTLAEQTSQGTPGEQTDLGTSVDQTDQPSVERTDGPLDSSSPTTSPLTPSSPTTSPIASQPRALAGLTPIENAYLSDTREAPVNGETLANSMIFSLYSSSVGYASYNLSRDYVELQVTLGVADYSPTNGQCQFEIVADGKSLVSQSVPLGVTHPVTVNITNVLRLNLRATGPSDTNTNYCVYGSALITPEP